MNTMSTHTVFLCSRFTFQHFHSSIMCRGFAKSVVGTGVFLILFSSLGLFALGIYTAIGSTLRFKDNYLLILIFICASLLFVASILGLLTLFGENRMIAILYAITLIGIIGLEVYLAVVFMGGTKKDFSPKQMWLDLSEDARSSIEHRLECCGYDSTSESTNCSFTTTCKQIFDDAFYRDKNLIAYSMIAVAALQLINILFVGFVAGCYRDEKNRNKEKTLLEEARETRIVH